VKKLAQNKPFRFALMTIASIMPEHKSTRPAIESRLPAAPNSNTQELRQMPKGTIKFTCLRINLKRISTFEPDEGQIGSLIEFDLKIGNRSLNALSVEVRQRYGTDFQNEPLEVGNVIGYNGPWNSEEFQDLCSQYYRDIIGSSGVGHAIKRGERKLIERVAIRVDRGEEINLPLSAETMADAKAG
jgi:hypothetical protein